MPVTSPEMPNHPSNDRYSRQILFPGIGPLGQQLLARSHVGIVGVGATGTAAASLLARAGVGALTVIDRDFVETSNLQRQILFDESDAEQALPKAEAARRHIARFNSSILVQPHVVDLAPGNIHRLLAPTQLILDATDNFETRYLINDYAVQQTKPWIYAAAIGAYAATMNILPRGEGGTSADSVLPASASDPLNSHLHTSSPTACLSCIFPSAPTGPVETCDTAGILSTAVNLAASVQVTEALKFLTGQSHLMRRTLWTYDLWTNIASQISTDDPDPECSVCAHRVFSRLSGAGRPHLTLCGRNSVQIHEHARPIYLPELHARLAAHALAAPDEVLDLRSNDLLLRFRRPPHTVTVFPDGRALIQGTTDIGVARSLYARFIGC